MAGRGEQTAHKGLRRLTAIVTVAAALAGAAGAQAAPPPTAPGSAHSAAYDHQPVAHAGRNTGHRVH